MLSKSLQELLKYNQFIIWTMTDNNKTPISPHTLLRGDPHKTENQLSYNEANKFLSNLNKSHSKEYHLGFVLTKNDPFFFVDIDKCLINNAWAPIVSEVLRYFPGAAVEISQSGSGLHILGKAALLPHSCKNSEFGLEFYTESRFIALTDYKTTGDINTECSKYLQSFINTYFPPKVSEFTDWTTEPVPEYTPFKSDAELLKKAKSIKSSGSVFGNKCTFKDLFDANVEKLSIAYPDSYSNREYDYSSADASLAQHLAFWTGKNCEHIRNLMFQSKLKREKWDREDYVHSTIVNSVSNQQLVYTSGKKIMEPIKSIDQELNIDSPQITEGYQYLTPDLQLKYFKDCVYILENHRIFTPMGFILKPESFNAWYGGYVFQMDEVGDRTSKKAFEAFTENQYIRFPKAHSSIFRPDLPVGKIELEGCIKYVNTYVPIETPSEPGDITPFLTHLDKILPNARDKEILLSYMAACVQYKGVKFQWAPLLQGVEGNGKTLFTRCLANAIGHLYSHFPNARDIDNKFNGWLANKLFIGVEDIYIKESRKEVIEALKPMITNERQEIQFKGSDQVTKYICANLLLNSNYKNAVQKTENDRRFCVFFTAQQEFSDLEKCGIGGDYFMKLYDWLKDVGYKRVTNYLTNYKIPDEFNPAKNCNRAPKTSTTAEVLKANLGPLEQEVTEAIQEDKIGFKKGWISSVALCQLFKNNLKFRIPPRNKWNDILKRLGYIKHPLLPEGRAGSASLIDGNQRPRLYITSNHKSLLCKSKQDVLNMYIDDQQEV